MKVLELFAGTRSIGKAFEARGHEVFSIEWDKRFENIDLYADIMTVTAADIIRGFGRPDVIWASPDCTTFSIAAISHHRHHKPVVGHKFSIGCTDGKEIVGVAIVGRPVSRHLDDGWTLEVNRLCTDGTHNACSMLYAAAWRAARAMGYKRLVTYILDSESGTSLKASGWKCVGQAGGLRWTGKRRPEVDLYPAQMKIRWEKEEHDGSVD